LLKKSNNSQKRKRDDIFNSINKYQRTRQQWNSALAYLDKVSDTGKYIGYGRGTSVLTLRDDGVRAAYGNGQGPGDNYYDPQEKSPYKSKTLFKRDLARGIYNIYSEFNRYVNAIGTPSNVSSVSRDDIANARRDLMIARADFFTPNNYDGNPDGTDDDGNSLNITFAVNLDKALRDEAYQSTLQQITNLVNIINGGNANLLLSDVSNIGANISNVYNSMKRAIYLKAYRMIDHSRRKIVRNSSYDIRIGNRAVTILQAVVPELNDTVTYFRNREIPGGARPEIEALYNTELDFIYASFVTEAEMEFNDSTPNVSNDLANFFINPYYADVDYTPFF